MFYDLRFSPYAKNCKFTDYFHLSREICLKTSVTYREIWLIAYPIIIGSVAQNILNITDTAFLGRVGQVALGAGAIGGIFYVHLFFVSILLAYFPFSKLMHMGGVFLSPTRNLANDNRARRHINPWNHPVKVHTYEEYEDEFRDKIKEVGLPVDKE